MFLFIFNVWTKVWIKNDSFPRTDLNSSLSTQKIRQPAKQFIMTLTTDVKKFKKNNKSQVDSTGQKSSQAPRIRDVMQAGFALAG